MHTDVAIRAKNTGPKKLAIRVRSRVRRKRLFRVFGLLVLLFLLGATAVFSFLYRTAVREVEHLTLPEARGAFQAQETAVRHQ